MPGFHGDETREPSVDSGARGPGGGHEAVPGGGVQWWRNTLELQGHSLSLGHYAPRYTGVNRR